ncbi:MAG TPA: universal stress protein [Cryomorphaceae bacterium]|nr:universal stress protein [Cryomorphaceae bacterium]HKL39685.1 universal stress protein [Cryomorphaceae bacterium]
MKKILVFVNFIEASQRAVDQSVAFGRMHDSLIYVCHISDGKDDEETLRTKLQPYLDQIDHAGLKPALIFEVGGFFETASKVAKQIVPDLVVVGTRGADGFDMSLRGSAIYKLVSELPYSSLVLPTDSSVAEKGFHKIMLPVSPHPKFLKKVSETRKVLAAEGEIVILTVLKKGEELDEDSKANLDATVEYLKENKVKSSTLAFERENRSTGYAAVTLRKAKEDGMDLISIISNVSERNKHFGKMEKEDVLLNEEGIPVFCVNTAIDK